MNFSRHCFSEATSLACAFTVGIAAFTATAQTNWPSFRGPFATGLAMTKQTPAAWDVETRQNILWQTSVPGLGHSSPVIWENRLFVTTAINQKKSAPLKVGLYGDPESAEDSETQQWRVICL